MVLDGKPVVETVPGVVCGSTTVNVFVAHVTPSSGVQHIPIVRLAELASLPSP
jgi:hypothetical protein